MHFIAEISPFPRRHLGRQMPGSQVLYGNIADLSYSTQGCKVSRARSRLWGEETVNNRHDAADRTVAALSPSYHDAGRQCSWAKWGLGRLVCWKAPVCWRLDTVIRVGVVNDAPVCVCVWSARESLQSVCFVRSLDTFALQRSAVSFFAI